MRQLPLWIRWSPICALLIYPPGYTLSRQIKGLTRGRRACCKRYPSRQLAMVGIILAMIARWLGVKRRSPWRQEQRGFVLQRLFESADGSSHREVEARRSPPRQCLQRGKGSGRFASAYPITAMAAAFSRSSRGTILSSVSAAV